MNKFFPFYKGKNIANNPLGYTTAANARKRMNDQTVKDDFLKTLPEDYWLDYYKVYELANPWTEEWMKTVKEPGYGISAFGTWYNITIYTKGYTKHQSDKYLRELPEDVYNLFLKLYKMEDIVMEDYYAHKTTYKEDYKNLIYEILSKGYYPHLFKDDKDYKSRYTKFVTDNVEFREMDVNVRSKEVSEIDKSYPCDGGIRGTTQRLDVQLSGKLRDDVKRVMTSLLYTYESYKSDWKGDFDSSQFKREYLYNEIEKFIDENK